MTIFRGLLAIMLVTISVYTVIVTADYGLTLFQIFFSDILSLTWPGQFNLDFTFMLMLSGLWVAWRHKFSAPGIALGLVAFVGGIVFLSTYLLVMSTRANGSIEALLLGDRYQELKS